MAMEDKFDFVFNKIKSKYCNINSIDEYGNTFLHYAIINKNEKNIYKLLNLGCNPNIQNKHGNTPLHTAVYHMYLDKLNLKNEIQKNFNIIKNLLYFKAKRNILNIDGKYFYELAPNIFKKDAEGNTLLHSLINLKKIYVAMFIIEYFYPDLNIQNNIGNTILHNAVILAVNNFDNIEYFYFLNFLIKKGANENILNNNNNCPFNYLSLVF
jgi:ankyrin repeat protein